ncbi:MAG: hypothetical protein M0027_02735 [Candidatus Dormibacteraeota bacterium]|nr:hypothetical protein [Candidatus Dormibacteraeota bacterium]
MTGAKILWPRLRGAVRRSGKEAPVAWLAAAMALAVLVVAVAYACSRASYPGATAIYWVGQGLLYGAPALYLLRAARIDRSRGAGVALLVAVTTYLINQAYSPGQMRFLDEFEHVLTVQGILSSHHLFTPNISLLVSPQYPGLEVVTSAVVSVTNLPIQTAAPVVVGVLHCLTVLGLYLLALEITARPRLAALAVLIYACEPHFQFFDSYFIYQVMALPFLVATLLAATRMVKARSVSFALAWGTAALLLAAVTTMSHHLTSYVMWLLLICIAVGFIIRRGWRGVGWRLPGLLLASGGLIAGWDLGVATATVTYFQHNIVSLLVSPRGHHRARPVPVPTAPRFDLLLEFASIALLCFLLILGGFWVWRSRRRDTYGLWVALGVASISLLAAIAARVLFSGGAELWGRAATFVMIPSSVLVASALLFVQAGALRPRRTPGGNPDLTAQNSARARGWLPGPPRGVVFGLHRITGWICRGPGSARRRRLSWVGVAAVVVLGLGGIAGGWPPFYARLPGPFLAEAWERSIDAHELDLATWAATRITHYNGVASDFITASVLGTLGHQANVGGLPQLFLSSSFTAADARLVTEHRVTLVVVDQRLLRLRPEDGSYFSGSPGPGGQQEPLPRPGLDKFSAIPGVSRIFDDGSLIVYDLTGSATTRAAP